MDFNKIIITLTILGICFTVALTYTIVVNIFVGLPVQPVAVAMLAIGYVVMIKKKYTISRTLGKVVLRQKKVKHFLTSFK